MDISVKDLQEAISIRQQIDNLQRRLSSLLRGAPQRPTAPTAPTAAAAAGRYFSPTTRAKLAAAARARWARRRGTGGAAPAKKKGQLTPAGRRKLSQLMKARWAARRKAGSKQATAVATNIGQLLVDLRSRLYDKSNCSREDSNLHGLPHTVLSRTRLPVPPREQKRGFTMRGW